MRVIFVYVVYTASDTRAKTAERDAVYDSEHGRVHRSVDRDGIYGMAKEIKAGRAYSGGSLMANSSVSDTEILDTTV